MELDLPTLMVAGSFVAAISGAFLIFAWMQTEQANGMLWFAAADLVLAAAIPLVANTGATAGSAQLVVAITLLNIGPALIWASARATNHRRVDYAIVGSGAIIWLIAYAMPGVRDDAALQTGLNMAIIAAFLLAAAYEFWRGRSERLMARWPLIILLVLHGGFSAVGAFDAIFDPSGRALFQNWLAFIHFETLAFVVGTSIFTVAMARERNEMQHKIAATTDSLTGVATRRAFYETGEAMVTETTQTDGSLAIILFDLDGFKAINDTYGHGPGDEVLRLFGEAALKTLRGSDLIGRLGGEEFGALLPGASLGAAYVAAERIRAAFTAACEKMDKRAIPATVSAGIAQAQPNSTLDSLMQAADLALYRAKMQGRNRVEVSAGREGAPLSPATETATVIDKIAKRVA